VNIKAITTAISKAKIQDVNTYNVLSTESKSISDLLKHLGKLSKTDDYLIVIVKK
jgi:hypothetical protein